MTSTNSKQEALLTELLKDSSSPQDILGEHGLLKQLTKMVVERALEGELTAHLGYSKHDRHNKKDSNSRNGKNEKTLLSDSDSVVIEVPRDRNGSFEPQLVKKRQRRLEGFDEKVLYLYSSGLSTREIEDQLKDLYGADVSPTLISKITDGVLDELHQWQSRPLERIYPIIYFDALFVKSRQEGPVQNRAVYLALGVNMEGNKELLGIWISKNEGSKFWLSVFTDLKNRGVTDCLIACVDGLKGLPEAIETVFPETQVQLCIVHRVRNSLKFVSWKNRKEVAADLRSIYGSPTLIEAEKALEYFAERWDEKYPAISASWRADWERLIPMFDYPEAIRKAIYTTNAIESLNYSMRKILKNRGVFPNDESIMKLLYLGISRVSKKWTQPIKNWPEALNQFAILFGERITG